MLGDLIERLERWAVMDEQDARDEEQFEDKAFHKGRANGLRMALSELRALNTTQPGASGEEGL